VADLDPRVDAYMAALAPEQREPLETVRRRVRELVPEAEDTLAYGMPAFRLGGKFLLSYAGWKKHCTIYPIDDDLLGRHAAEVGGYTSTKGGLHFTSERPLPDALLVDLVRGRVEDVRKGRS
jgi:uncharacterized protein YdhG (YjbR/CyaY superfamily)